MGIRFALLISAVIAGYGVIMFHLYDLQVEQSDYYIAKAGSQYSLLSATVSRRGSIYFTDRNGDRTPAATNKDFPVVYAVPSAFEDISESANQIALIIDEDASDLISRFNKNDTYVLLDKRPSSEVIEKIQEADISGLYVEGIPGRTYPFGSLAAHVLGFVGPNSSDNGESGKYGLEKEYNSSLSGVPGSVEENRIIPSSPGENIELTIDASVQTEAERILSSLVSRFNAKGGGAIVQNIATGGIIAMSAEPKFDPNKYFDSGVGNFLNPVVEAIYEPGSVFKVFTMAAGIDAGAITPDTVYTDTGLLELNGRTIRNWDLKAHGRVTMTNVLEKSLNTGAAFAARKTGVSAFTDYLEKFGFGSVSGIDLPGELSGTLGRLNDNPAEINLATASFGQGVAATPLQVINAISAIANGGTLMRPYLNADFSPEEINRVISEDSARQVTEMMISAVDEARVAAIDGYSVAGKTGTAQVPDLVRGGYTDRVVNTYVGFFPASDPEFSILIKLDEPGGAPLAGLTVVPAFRELAQFMINYYNIPPDRISN